MPSRFLGEMPQENLKHVESTAPSWRPMAKTMGGGSSWKSSGTGSKVNTGKQWGRRSTKDDIPTVTGGTQPAGKQVGDYIIGSRVFHQKFGYGAIRKSEGKGETQRLTIQFEKAGQKKLVAALAKLEVV
jgi:DNA helicase-2/ATP-dependent DNA helicase PcrA